MPIYEYACEKCSIEFEELLNSSEKDTYFEWHPCPNCGEKAARIQMSKVSFQFSGGQVAGSGVHGNSGSHDLDYPNLDKAIGRSSENKWKNYNEQKDQRDAERRKLGTNSIREENGKISAVESARSETREKAWKLFNEAKKK